MSTYRGFRPVQNARDIRVVHEGQRLPLGFEAGDHLPRVHAWLEDLECYLAADRMLLLRHKDNSEPSFADLLDETIRANHFPRPLIIGLHAVAGSSAAEKVPGLSMRRKQALHQ